VAIRAWSTCSRQTIDAKVGAAVPQGLHVGVVVPRHTPVWQVSGVVQAIPSSHVLPSGFAGLVHWPVAELQLPASWHWSLAVQTTGSDPAHVPAWQRSCRVHALPSMHAVPFGFIGFEQTPLAGSHVPASWHWSLATQTTGSLPVHAPLRHASVRVHALPSSQPLPSGFGGFEHSPVAGSHVPGS
jgi:hypothetical protein